MYQYFKPFLFSLKPEFAHQIVCGSLNILEAFNLLRPVFGPMPKLPVKVMGLDFPNPIGLAAGFDKSGQYYNALGRLGFGFIEVGTVTPRAQSGNKSPRLFRIPEQEALINRMGFNNNGVDYLVNQLKLRQYPGILGVNIGKNADTPINKAVEDYLYCLERVYSYSNYITVNISSPNTPGLRSLQEPAQLAELLEPLKELQTKLAQRFQRYVPLAVKISPDVDDQAIQQLAESFNKFEVDGVIATNTTSSRPDGVRHHDYKEAGGLSGRPLTKLSTQVLKKLRKSLSSHIPIIASGGVMTREDVVNKLNAGAALVQIYTGMIYSGPQFIQKAVSAVQRNAIR